MDDNMNNRQSIIENADEHYEQFYSEEKTAEIFCGTCETSFGKLTIVATDKAITEVHFGVLPQLDDIKMENNLIILAAKQIEEYAAGQRKRFELPLSPNGTAFQKSVWRALISIPYGETCTYKQIAQQIGNPAASRAVGMANNKNPIPIIIPCHRVIGSNGALIGYAGGLEVKKQLLSLEAQYAKN